ncbi:tetratricopeptide repeat protein [Catenovulum agarivorans]|uniref:tetratricopeptide repeat protein n=1 Tax=Catenovulum agarivorans TaxID=1172192 RepID=UPI0002F96868|nr:sel1 repeat family protein [Catenovulum agarivorans]
MQKNKSTEEELSLDTDLVPDNWDELPDLEIFDDEDLSFVKHQDKDQQLESDDDLVLDELDEILDDDLLDNLHADTQDDAAELSLDDAQLINDNLLIDEDELLQDNLTDSTSGDESLSDFSLDEASIEQVELQDIELDDIELAEDELELNIQPDTANDNSVSPSTRTMDKLAQHQSEKSSPVSANSKEQPEHVNQQLMNSLDSLAAQLNQLTQVVSDLLQQKSHTEPEPVDVQKLFSTGVYYAKHADYIHAAKWFRRAAMASHGKAMFYLGMMFIKGEGLPKSIIHSYVWMSLANVYGVSEAKAAMMDIQHRLTAHELNQAQRLAAEKYEEIENIQAKLALKIPSAD